MPPIPLTLARILPAVQGAYFAGTGLWPLVHLPSFLAVTGPKEDLWLVQTVGALALAIGAALLVAALSRESSGAVWTLGGASALAFLLVDLVFYSAGILRAVYLLDAVAELVFLVGWVAVAIRSSHRTSAAVRG